MDIMPSLDEITVQIKSLGGTGDLYKCREIKELPRVLWEDENIERIISGKYGEDRGIIVATNKRLVIVVKRFFSYTRVTDFSYDKITSIQYQTGLIFGDISIFASGNREDIGLIEKSLARNFAEYVRARITKPTEHASKRAQEQLNDSNASVQLKKLEDLKNEGILTDEEYSSFRKRILN